MLRSRTANASFLKTNWSSAHTPPRQTRKRAVTVPSETPRAVVSSFSRAARTSFVRNLTSRTLPRSSRRFFGVRLNNIIQCRMSNDERMTKPEARNPPRHVFGFAVRSFGICHLGFLRASSFGFRPIVTGGHLCIARSTIRWHSSGKPIPAAAAALGSKLVSVMPGSVFTSSTTGSPPGFAITSTRP